MTAGDPQAPATTQGVVVGSSRRFVHLLDAAGNFVKAQASSRALDVVVGDQVVFAHRKGEAVVLEILPSKNALSRSYRDDTRKIAANLDQLFIVTAVGPLFNTFFIDRIMTVATHQSIPFTLVVNKMDLGVGEVQHLVTIYEKIGVSVVYTSAKHGSNLELLEQSLSDPNLRIVALGGMSGVGKSALLNQLIPGTDRKTAAVSERTGQGRQTTTQAYAYVYHREMTKDLLVIDLPGIQSFGVTHLSIANVADSFPEIVEHAYECEFGNCSHIAEDNCAVKTAVAEGEMAAERYESYVRMVSEIEEARPY